MKSFKHNFLDLPDSFEANSIPKGNETPSGIIKRIKSEVSVMMRHKIKEMQSY